MFTTACSSGDKRDREQSECMSWGVAIPSCFCFCFVLLLFFVLLLLLRLFVLFSSSLLLLQLLRFPSKEAAPSPKRTKTLKNEAMMI